MCVLLEDLEVEDDALPLKSLVALPALRVGGCGRAVAHPKMPFGLLCGVFTALTLECTAQQWSSHKTPSP